MIRITGLRCIQGRLSGIGEPLGQFLSIAVFYSARLYLLGFSEDKNNSLTFGVADEHVGAVVGRGGRNIMEISQASGARLKISDRGDFMFGTSDRKVTITGSKAAIRAAENMIMQKVAYATEG